VQYFDVENIDPGALIQAHRDYLATLRLLKMNPHSDDLERIEDLRKVVFEAYSQKYDGYRSAHKLHTILEVFNPFMYLELFASILFTDDWDWPHAPLATNVAPEAVWAKYREVFEQLSSRDAAALQRKLETMISDANSRIVRMCEECVVQVPAVVDPGEKAIFTSGRFDPISILPGKSKTLIVPITQWTPENAPERISCNIYDIVTETDAASNPTKRDNLAFEFELIE